MNRFMGLMPSEFVERIETFLDAYGMGVTIEAGSKGWTVIWPDHTVSYDNVDDTAENNFNRAYAVAEKVCGPFKRSLKS